MAKRPTVQHWIACLEVRAVRPVAVNNFYDLLRVSPTHTLPADVEFPASYAQLDLFARFVGGSSMWYFEIEALWVDAPGKPLQVALYGPSAVHFRPGQSVRDHNFRLNNIPLPGVGRYRFELWLLGRGPRRMLAVEYLEVEQQP
jgi:hypothetical protein